MPKPKKPLVLDDATKLAIIDAQIRLHVQLISRLAAIIEVNAERLNRAPTISEEEQVNFYRRELRKYLLRRQRLSCAMHTNQEKEQA